MSNKLSKKKVAILFEEYKMADSKVEAYTNKQVNYLNITILLISGFYLYLISKNPSQAIQQLYPYFSFLIYGTLVYHYRRNLIVQGHRRFLAKKLNAAYEKNLILFPILTRKFSNNFGENWFLIFNVIAWLAILVGIFVYSHYQSKFMNGHALFQLMIIGAFIVRFVNKDHKLEDIIEAECEALYSRIL